MDVDWTGYCAEWLSPKEQNDAEKQRTGELLDRGVEVERLSGQWPGMSAIPCAANPPWPQA